MLTLESALITTSGQGLNVKIYSSARDTCGPGRMVSIKDIPNPLKAVIFDLDDTLVLSTVDFAKFKHLVIERIVRQGEDGKLYSPNETIVAILDRYEQRMLAQGVPENEIRARLAELDRIMDEVELERVSETEAIEGAANLLQLLRAKGIKVGILTRGCHEYAEEALSRTGLLSFVDKLECRNSETKAKPDPQAYLNLVRSLGIRVEETIFIGDHPIDARCAENAGVIFIAVESGDVPRELLLEAGSAEIFKHVGEMIAWFEDILSG